MQTEIVVENRCRPNVKPLARLRGRIYISTALAIAGLTFCLNSQANSFNLVTNGNFQVGTNNTGLSSKFGPSGAPQGAGYVTNWTAGSGIQFVVTTNGPGPGAGCTTPNVDCSNDPASQFGIPFGNNSRQGLWTGPSSTILNGGPTQASSPISKNGFVNPPAVACMNGGQTSGPCNYVALDGDPSFPGIMSQTINNLKKNHEYDLTFWFAASQLRDPSESGTGVNAGRVGSVADGVQVSLGSEMSPVLFPLGGNLNCADAGMTNNGGVPPPPQPNCTIGSRGFAGWTKVTEVFTATTGSETLKFEGIGAPNGLPPITLITGVHLTPVPEPSTWTLLGGGLVLLGIASISRKRLASGLDNA